MAEYSRALEANKKLPAIVRKDSRTIADALTADYIDKRTSAFNERRTTQFNKSGTIVKPFAPGQIEALNSGGSEPFSLNRSLLNP